MKTDIYRLSDNGLSQRAIAAELGVSKTYVQQILAERGPDNPQRILVLPDPHVPDHDRKLWDNVLKYASTTKWDQWVCLGDLLDFAEISSFNDNRRDMNRNDCIPDQFQAGNNWLDELAQAVGDVPGHYIEGNHEYRMVRYLQQMPEAASLLSIPNNLRLKDRNVTFYPYWHDGRNGCTIGKVTFIHGYTTVMHHAKKTVSEYHTNVIYGHTHDVQEHALHKLGDNTTIMATSAGCLQNYNPPYMRGRPSKWQQAFGVVYVWPNGNFNHFIVKAFDGHFVAPDGRGF